MNKLPKSKPTKHKKRPITVPKRVPLNPFERDFGDYHLMAPKITFRPDEYPEIPHSFMAIQLAHDCAHRPDMTEKTREANYASIINKCHASYTSALDIDQKLNKFDTNSDFDDIADIVDFSQYEPLSSDILGDAISVQKDISLLWSPSEYTCVKFNDALEFRLKRLNYNQNDQTISYLVCCYEKRILFVDQIVELLSFAAEIKVGAIDLKQAINDCREENDTETVKNDLNRAVTAALRMSLVMDGDFNLNIHNKLWFTKVLTMNYDIYPYGKKFISVESTQNSFLKNKEYQYISTNALKMLDCDMIFPNMRDMPDNDSSSEDGKYVFKSLCYVLQKMMMSIAAIVITNHMLRQRKLSRKPISERIINHVPSDAAENNEQTISRKTRTLGSITITSNDRPKSLSMERIIRYSASQWNRTGFLRHYKSGKIVEIKPTTVHRRCVDMEQNTSKSTNGTTYIVKGGKPTNDNS